MHSTSVDSDRLILKVERLLDRRRPVPHLHFDRHGERDMRAGVGRRLPRHIAHARHMDEKAVRAEFPGFRQFVEGRLHAESADDMQGDRQAELAADFPRLLIARQIDLAAHEHADELVGRREVLLADAPGVAGIFRLLAPALEIAEHGAPAGRAEPLDRGVGMFGRVMDLADVHDRGHAGVDLRDAGEQLVDVDVLRAIAQRQFLQDRLIIIVRAFGPPVVDENAVGEKAAQRRLELMAVRVDEARHDDMPGRVDDRGVGRVDPGRDLGDFRSVDEHVADGVIADALVHRENRSALDQRAPPLNADALGHNGGRGAMRGFEIDGGGAGWLVRIARSGAGRSAELRRGDLTNLAHGRPSCPRSPRRLSRRRWRNRTESGSGRQFPGYSLAVFAAQLEARPASPSRRRRPAGPSPPPQVKLSERPRRCRGLPSARD